MRPIVFVLSLALLWPASVLAATNASPDEGNANDAISAALADPARSDDADDDARRKPGAVLRFAGLEPGQKVLELIPGGGYWTRIFSAVVDKQGHVYELIPDEVASAHQSMVPAILEIIEDRHYRNVSLLRQPAAELSTPEPVDLVFTAQNYHDYMNMLPVDPKADAVSLDTQAFAALKPGGVFLITDHVAAPGAGVSQTDTLHRIEPAVVKAQAEAAGFVFEGASDALRNPDDSHDKKVFDPSIRGHTDQFIYKFRKPMQ
ncbi:class I SAM-dependent methyltransferase [Salinisphaera aquimarina]|uniref:Class I SAM-dependent methyltransferase n=1 Tax=Salinisphaera aquimarina TaxID=2094031 RepID=A0ABV7EK96_9GAMM